MTPAQIVARQTADRMSHERALRCIRACSGLSDSALEADVVGKVREALEAIQVIDINGSLLVSVNVPSRGFWSVLIDGDGRGMFEDWSETRNAALSLLSQEDKP